MVVFIPVVKHYENSADYTATWDLLRNTLHSVCAQTDDRFRVIVVCNKVLDDFSHDVSIRNTEFLEVDFPAPSHGIAHPGAELPNLPLDAVRKDKGSKYVIGILAAKKYTPTYVMPMDADDFLSNRLVSSVMLQPTEPGGWVCETSYIINISDMTLAKKTLKSTTHGSCMLHNFESLCFEGEGKYADWSGLSTTSTKDDVLDKTDSWFLRRCLGGHNKIGELFRKRGIPHRPFDFPVSMYNVSHDENHSHAGSYEYSCDADLEYCGITQEITKEFNLRLK